MQMNSIKQGYLSAPDTQIDPHIKPLIEEWSDPPTALQMLRVLDAMVHGGSASAFAVSSLDTFMRIALKQEGTTFEALVDQAHWREGECK
jgi:hypothetical protein